MDLTPTQLVNCFWRVREELANGPRLKIWDATSQERMEGAQLDYQHGQRTLSEREFNVDAGCVTRIISLSGETLLEFAIKQSAPFKLFEQVLMKIMICVTSLRLRVRKEVLEEPNTCQIGWLELSSTILLGAWILAPISDVAYDRLSYMMRLLYRNDTLCFKACSVCFGRCEDADLRHTVASRLGNCVRCSTPRLCPKCKVIVSGQPVCYHCIDWKNDTLLLPPAIRQRIEFLSRPNLQIPDDDDKNDEPGAVG